MSGLFAPPQASSIAGQVDALVLLLLVTSVAISAGIFACIVVFCVRYRQRPGNIVGQRVTRTWRIELAWTLIPTGLAMVPFAWGAWLYLQEAQPPADSIEVYVVAKQWMWKAQQPDGQAEIDGLHVPEGRAIKLTMTSQDVIHSFSVPAFRLKADVLPGRFTTLWFQPTQVGEFRLYCSEYCGTDHSRMLGSVTVMRPADYAQWLTSGATAANSPAALGRELYRQYGCVDCHSTGRAPNLQGVYGQPVLLSDNSTVVADENYLRESILAPSAKIVNGYQPSMPSFAGQLDEEQIIQLIEFVKSIGGLAADSGPPPPPPGAPMPGPSPVAVP
ncbi:MAG: cytochrome c oxidase subunit II [Chloroflexota bacterium]|nr:cytochrome c oxidase subunit II [Chloroflexota bacterium]